MSRIPKTIGPYRILELLGLGGMGVVYRAEHRGSGRPAALKTVRVPQREGLAALRREIHALALLRHPGIVPIFEEGLHSGVPWYAMELLDGQSLRRFLTSPVAAGEAIGGLSFGLGLVRRLCAALGFLHGEGLVHRDLKPENVWLRPGGQPVLMDFGVVSRFGGELGREQLEMSGRTSGTMGYMPPEQIRGDLCDARADLYSLGCILYELCTGRPPFTGPGAMQVLRQHLEAEPEPPSRLAPGLSDRLEALILRLLQKEPRKRPGYAGDVAAVLLALEGGLEAVGAVAEAGAAGEEAEPAPRARAYLYRPRFVGREQPLRDLLNRLGRAEEGRGSVMLLGGESGSGKTRLLMELAGEGHRRGLHVLAGECVPRVARSEEGGARSDEAGRGADSIPGTATGLESARAPRGRSGRSPAPAAVAADSGPLGALRRPLLVLGDLCRERGRAETERLLGPRGRLLAPYEPALALLPGHEAWLEAGAQDVVPLPPEEARLRLFHALAETFAALAKPGTPGSAAVLLVLDDLHWADELTLGFLKFLARTEDLKKRRILAVGAYRTEEVGARQGKPLQRLIEACTEAGGAPPLHLGRLEKAAVGSIVADMLAMPAPPKLFVDFLTRQSEGNAFFVAEYLRTAIARDVLYRGGDGTWQVAEPGPEEATAEVFEALPLPGSVRSLVERRLEGLGAAARLQAEAAAVLGRDVDEALAGGLARLGSGRRMEAIQELVAREVLEEAGAGRLRFAHDKIREVTYQGIPAGRRRRLHRAAAQGIAGLQRAEDLTAVARHWEGAGELGRARPLYLQAARRARSIYALAEADGLYRAYLDLAPKPEPECVQARNEYAFTVLFALGRNQEALAELDQALEEAKSCEDEAGHQDAWTFRSEITWKLGGAMEANKEAAQHALELAQRYGDTAREGRALTVLGRAEAELGHSKQAEECFEQARRKLHGTKERLRESQTLANLAIVYRRQGRLAEALELFGEALQIEREIGDRFDEGKSLANLAGVYYSLWDLRKASELLEQALRIHREVGNLRSEAMVLSNMSRLCWLQGEPEDSRGLLEQSLVLARKIGHRPVEGLALRQMARLEQMAAGDLERAAALLLQAESVHEAEGLSFQVAQCRCQFGHLELARGRTARPFLRQAEDLASKLESRWTDLDEALTVLRQTTEAFEAGVPLFRGHLWENLPEGLQHWLIQQGHKNGGSSLF